MCHCHMPYVTADSVDANDVPSSVGPILVSSVVVDNLTADNKRIPDEQRLYKNLLNDYEPSVRPLVNSSETIVVTFRLTLNQIVDLVRLTRDLVCYNM